MTARPREFRTVRSLLAHWAGYAAGYLVLLGVGRVWTVELRGPLLFPDGNHLMYRVPHPVVEVGARVVLPLLALATTVLWLVLRATAATRTQPRAARIGALAGAAIGGILGCVVLYLSATVVDGSSDAFHPTLAHRVEDVGESLNVVLGRPLQALGPVPFALLGPMVDWAILGTGLGLLFDLAKGRSVALNSRGHG